MASSRGDWLPPLMFDNSLIFPAHRAGKMPRRQAFRLSQGRESKVRDLRHRRRLEIVNGSKPYSSSSIGRTTSRGHLSCVVRWSLSAHPGPLPWGEGEPFSLRSTIQTFLLSLRSARCSLSLRERVRVRGNGANDPLADRTAPGTVELDEIRRSPRFPK